jgi:hypothetical protein
VFDQYSGSAFLNDIEFSARRAEVEEGSVSTEPNKKKPASDLQSWREKLKSSMAET